MPCYFDRVRAGGRREVELITGRNSVRGHDVTRRLDFDHCRERGNPITNRRSHKCEDMSVNAARC